MKTRIAIVAIAFGVLACLPSAFGQEPQKKQKMDPNKPAGEAFKNVQLLKEMPAGQFMQTMHAFNTSLGVTCDFCHAQDRSSDEKGHKVIARKMIEMNHQINANFFAGKMEVRCFTCHQGKEHPVSAPAEGAMPAEHKN